MIIKGVQNTVITENLRRKERELYRVYIINQSPTTKLKAQIEVVVWKLGIDRLN